MRRLLLPLLFSFALTTQAKEGDSPMARDIRKFFELTHVAELSFADIKNNMELQRRANPDIPDEFWKELLNKLSPDEFLNRIAPVYEKHFSHEDIKAWIAFFESAPGQAFLKSQTVVLKESAAAGQAYVEEIAGPLLEKWKKK